MDPNSRKHQETSHRMKRTSYLAELECKLCIAVNCKNYPTYESSSTFNLVYEYIEQCFDKADVITDIIPYLQLFSQDEAQSLREKVRQKIEHVEANLASLQPAGGGASQSHKLPDIKLIKWRVVHFKLSKLIGAYQQLEKQERLALVNQIFVLYIHGHA